MGPALSSALTPVCFFHVQLKRVDIRRYNKVSSSAFGLKGKKRIVVLRTSGAIVGRLCINRKDSNNEIRHGPHHLKPSIPELYISLASSSCGP
jgi:hypothetical protein